MHHLEMLLKRVKEDTNTVWTLQRVQELVGPDVSADACDRLLRRLERMGVLVPAESGSWIRAVWPGGAQRDWYS